MVKPRGLDVGSTPVSFLIFFSWGALCKGSTTDFDSVGGGSNPSAPATLIFLLKRRVNNEKSK